jgi:beta-galactosidase
MKDQLNKGLVVALWCCASFSTLFFISALPTAAKRDETGQDFSAKSNRCLTAYNAVSAHVRYSLSLNPGWRYFGGDATNAEILDFDDSHWTIINVPHTWNAQDTEDDEAGYSRGVGWYRRTLNLPHELKGKRLFIYFEGANQITTVFVNGKLAGKHKGGYTAFAFDITDLIQFESTKGKNANLIAVKIDNSADKNIPPLSADFDFYGGIYRNVWLIATDPIHFDLLDHGSSGIYVDTPTISAEAAVARIRAQVVNNDSQSRDVRLAATLQDANGGVIAQTDSSQEIGSGKEFEFKLQTNSIPHPHLWSPDNPYLYTLESRLYQNGHLLDEVDIPVGFRWFRIDPNEGFFLNGAPLKLHGVNKHQDYAGIGNAVPDSLAIRDMQIIKDMGANFVRLAHYPQSRAVLDAADRLGLIIWEEIPIVNEITPSEEFSHSCEQMLREMIRQHFNHPSILLWGYMNEVLLRLHKEPGYTQEVVALARRLDRVVHEEDPSRQSVMAMHHSGIYNESGLADIPQVVGWNLYFGWYEGEFNDFGSFLDDQHKRYPRRPLIVSEYGADADLRLHSNQPEKYDYTIEWQRLLHESYLDQIEQRLFLAGTTAWVAFDFGSEFRGESKPHMNLKGLLTFDRKPKDVYFLYQARFAKKPVLHVATRDWTTRAGDEPVQPIEIYTNLPRVELVVNGHRLETKDVGTSCRATWQVTLRDGLNTIEARSVNSRLRDRIQVQFTYYPKKLIESRGFREIAINAGSRAQYIDGEGTVWLSDQAYVSGGWGYVGGEVKRVRQNIRGTFDDHLSQFSRVGMQAYRFDVPDGRYEVELLLTEPEFTEIGKRVFTIDINGTKVISDLDLVEEGTVLRAFKKTFQVVITGGQGVRLNFTGTKPIVSGIRLRRI